MNDKCILRAYEITFVKKTLDSLKVEIIKHSPLGWFI